MRGLPQTVSALTTASADDALAVLASEPDECPVGEIMRRMLKRFTAPACCLYDPSSNRVVGTTDAATRTALRNAFLADDKRTLTLTPNPAIVGVNMLWTVVSDTLGNAIVSNAMANGYQRRSFYGLINTGLGFWRDAGRFPAVLVDQLTAQVAFRDYAEPLLGSLVPAGQTVCVEFVQPSTLPKWAFE